MSKAPTPYEKTQNLLGLLCQAEAALMKEVSFLEALHMRRGQDTVSVGINGRAVSLTVLGRDYMPTPAQGVYALRQAVIHEQINYVEECRSRVAGIRRQLVAAAKEC